MQHDHDVGGSPWDGVPSAAAQRQEAAREEAEAAREEEYGRHGWNINNLPRHQGSVLRYLEGDELITGVQVDMLGNLRRPGRMHCISRMVGWNKSCTNLPMVEKWVHCGGFKWR